VLPYQRTNIFGMAPPFAVNEGRRKESTGTRWFGI